MLLQNLIELNSLPVFQQLLHRAQLMYHMNCQIVRDPWPLVFPRSLILCDSEDPLAQQLSDTRYHSSQTHGGFHNTTLPSSGSTDLLFHLPLDVPGGGRLQGLLYNPSLADSQILCDLRSQHSVYSPASSFSQSYSSASSTYSTGDSSSRGAAPTAAAANIHQQSMEMSIASLDCTIPGSRGTMHLPCAHVPTVPSPVLYDVLPKAPKSRVKKKRKRPDARQLNALNMMYARTRYPPTPEREQLARDINMHPRTVQVWLAHLCLHHMYIFLNYRPFFSGSRTRGRRGNERTEIIPTLQSARSLTFPTSCLLYILMEARPLQVIWMKLLSLLSLRCWL